MKFKILSISLAISFLTISFASAQSGATHHWGEKSYFGGSFGTYSFGEDREGYFANAIGFYYSRLEHSHPRVEFNHYSDFGIIGTMSFFGDPEKDLSGTIQLSKGIWLDDAVLIKLGAGPAFSESNRWGVSSIALISLTFTQWAKPTFTESNMSINTAVVFLKGDRYSGDIFGPKWRVSTGISLGVGTLNLVHQ